LDLGQQRLLGTAFNTVNLLNMLFGGLKACLLLLPLSNLFIFSQTGDITAFSLTLGLGLFFFY
jgi:hypothetical protein